MSKMMIYAPLSATGGNIENVYGTKMRVRVIDASNKDEVDQAKADGWMPKADDVIEQIETEKLEAENKVMKGVLGGRAGDNADNPRINELEEQLTTALEEIAGFEQERAESDKVIDEKIARIAELEDENKSLKREDKDTIVNAHIEQIESENEKLKAKLAIYEESKDANGDGVVSYDEMTKDELKVLLEQRDVKFVERDSKDALIQKAKDSE